MRPEKIYTLFMLMIGSFCQLNYAQFSIQKCLVEVHTGAWNQYAPDGTLYLDTVANTNANVIPVNIHNGDGMSTTEGDNVSTFYAPAYPQATLNRLTAPVNRAVWVSTANSILAGAASVTVSFDSVLYDEVTRQVDVYLKATFTGPVNGDIRFNCIVVEDSVTGTGSSYNQVNAYNSVAGHPYFGAGNPIVGFVHRHVAREYLGAAFGTSGIIPASVNFGSEVTHHYSYTLPVGYDENKISLVGIVSKFDGAAIGDRFILNAESIDLPVVYNNAGIESYENEVIVYPNPVSTSFKILNNDFNEGDKITIINSEGKCVHMVVVSTQSNELMINIEHLPVGVYFVQWKDRTVKLLKE